MAANTGRHSRVAQPGYVSHHPETMWTKRDSSAGKFIDAKTHGGSFRGIAPDSRRMSNPRASWFFAIFGGVLLLGCSLANLLLPVNNLDLRGAGFASGTISPSFLRASSGSVGMKKSEMPTATWWLRLTGVLLLALGFAFTYLPAAPDPLGVIFMAGGLAAMAAGIFGQLTRRT